MLKNILIIGYGDIGQRLKTIINSDEFNIYALNRSSINEEGINKTSWDWLSGEPFKFKDISFDSVIIIPKPSEMSEGGYEDGFIRAIDNINNSLKNVSFKNLIAISSTRVYGPHQVGMLNEDSSMEPADFRGKTITRYESLLNKKHLSKLIVLRFSGLYDTNSDNKSFNRLHRDNAAKAINFFINNPDIIDRNNFINCSEDIELDETQKCISNEKIKKLGFKFDEYS